MYTCLPRLGLLAAILLATAGPLAAAEADRPNDSLALHQRSEEDLLVFRVHLRDRVLSEGLFGYRQAGLAGRPDEPRKSDVLLPLGEIAQLLEFPIQVDPSTGTAEGWLTDEGESFQLDLPSRQATVAGTTTTVGREMAEIHAEDIYVQAQLLSQWLPLDFNVDLAALELRLAPRRRLPIERRWSREARWRQFAGSASANRPGPRFPAAENPYRLVGWPVLDGSLDVSLRRRSNGTEATTARQSLIAQGDLLGMTADLFLGSTRGNEVVDPLTTARLTLARHDPEGELLGVLGATDFRLGDLASPNDPLISRSHPGRGFELARNTEQSFGAGPREFDRRTLRGDALPGWDVELYRNDVLYDFTTVGADGRYEILDVPLFFGTNVLRLVFYGPHGETREEIERVHIDAGILPPGETDYHVGIYQQDVGLFRSSQALAASDAAVQGEDQLMGGFTRGLTRGLSLDGGLCSIALPDDRQGPVLDDPVRHNYIRLGVRSSFWGTAGRLAIFRDTAGGTAGRLGLQRRVGSFTLAAEHTQFDRFVSEEIRTEDLLSQTRVRLDGQVRLPGAGILPLALTVRQERHKDSTSLNLRGSTGFTRSLGSINLTHRWYFDLTGSELNAKDLALRGNLLIHGWIRNFALRGNLGYDVQPGAEVTSLDLIGRWRPGQRLSATFGFNHSLAQNITQVSAGADGQLRFLRVGFDLGWGSDGSLRASTSLSFSLGREPRSGRLRLRGAPSARQGAVSARAFLDHNVNGRFDDGDEALEGARFTLNGGRSGPPADANGVSHLALAPFRHADLAVDADSLEDPFWVPQVDGLGFVPRPGVIWTADFPVVVTGEIDGTLTLRSDQGETPFSKMRLQLVDAHGDVVQEVESQFDGFYLFERVPPGAYLLRIDPQQALKRGLQPASKPDLQLGSGQVLTVDLEVHASGR